MTVVEYSPRWPQEFHQLARRLELALGPLALDIDHIGSTSVAGLPAKDCIDVQIRVENINDPPIGTAFDRVGFRLRPELWNRAEVSDGWSWPKLVFAAPAGERAANVHVRQAASGAARRNLLFRDFLRSEEGARTAWGSFKQRLAQTATDLYDYGQIKQPATDVLMIAAEDWARRSCWVVTPAW